MSPTPDRRAEIAAALEAARRAEAAERETEVGLFSAREPSPRGAATPLPEDPFDVSPVDEVVGRTIGRYVVRREIGHGGIGRVYLAERADGQFEQRVALKLVKRGMDTDEIVARFLRERQILARLEHPNIARLVDGGVYEDGRPYFVMEHVEGVPITQHCDERRLSIGERLRLFATVCRAVQYAHRNLVVHRDLKPNNVLVTESGEVKLLDFGIAKLLGASESDATMIRAPGIVLMTPEYASPEQVAGDAVTTASDVYQLGVLLYQLLTGHRPHERPGAERTAVLFAIRDEEPRRPSLVASDAAASGVATNAGLGAERLRRRLRGDLDAIALKAVRKEPEQRYASAEELAADVDRHLAHLPVRSARPAFAYQARKFVRRHRLGVTASLAFLALSVGFAALYTVRVKSERDRARREADKATESARLLRGLFRNWDPDAADRQAASSAQVLADAARQVERELRDRPETLATALSVLGDLNTSIGETAAADALLDRAESIQERLAGASADLAATLAHRGRLQQVLGDLRGAEHAFRRSHAIYLALLGADDAETLGAQGNLALVVQANQRLGEAEEIFRDVVARTPPEDEPRALIAAANLGYVLFLRARYVEAATLLRPTLERARTVLGDSHPLTLQTMSALSSSLRDPHRFAEAEALVREAHELRRKLYGDERPETRGSAAGLAVFLERKGDFEEAELWSRFSIATGIDGTGVHVETALRLRTLGGIRLVRGDDAEAESLLRRALAILRELFPQSTHADEGDVLNRLAFVADRRGAPDADALYEQAVAFERSRDGGPYFVTDGYEYLAQAAERHGDRMLAESLYRRAVQLYREQLPAGHPYRGAAASGLAALSAIRTD
jgi:serine/threonine-protein kinase